MRRRDFLKLSVICSSFLITNRLFSVSSTFESTFFNNLYEKEFDFMYSNHTQNGRFKEEIFWEIYSQNGIILKERALLKKDFVYRGDNKRACYSSFMYQKDRILYPLKRVGERGAGEWKRVDWQEAIDEIAKKIYDDVLNKKKIIIDSGGGLSKKGYRVKGLQNLRLKTGAFGLESLDKNRDKEFVNYKKIDKLDLVIFWGANPLVTNLQYAHTITKARYKGVKVVTITPEFNPTVKISDVWIPIKLEDELSFIREVIYTVVQMSNKNGNDTILKTLYLNIERFHQEENIKKFPNIKNIARELIDAKNIEIITGHHFDKETLLHVKLLSYLINAKHSFTINQNSNKGLTLDSLRDINSIILAGDNSFRKNSTKFKEYFLRNINYFVYMDTRFSQMALYADILLPIKGDYEVEYKDEGIYTSPFLKSIAESKSEDEIALLLEQKLDELGLGDSVVIDLPEEKKAEKNRDLIDIVEGNLSGAKESYVRFPFKLLVVRSRWSQNSTHRANQTLLRLQRGEPTISINPTIAKRKGIKDSQLVEVINENDRVYFKAKITSSVPLDIVLVEHGWEELMFVEKRALERLFYGTQSEKLQVDIQRAERV